MLLKKRRDTRVGDFLAVQVNVLQRMASCNLYKYKRMECENGSVTIGKDVKKVFKRRDVDVCTGCERTYDGIVDHSAVEKVHAGQGWTRREYLR